MVPILFCDKIIINGSFFLVMVIVTIIIGVMFIGGSLGHTCKNISKLPLVRITGDLYSLCFSMCSDLILH